MKKVYTLGLIVIMLFSLSITAWGSTIGVNVGEGASVTLEKTNFDNDSLKITGNFGVNDRLLIWLGYSTESTSDSDDATPWLGMRYEVVKNLAVVFEYWTQDELDNMDFGLRAKKALFNPLALVGEARYTNCIPEEGDSYVGYSLKAQAEYYFSQFITANLGVHTVDDEREGVDAETGIIAGMEVYPTEQLTWWIDYSSKQDNEKDIIGAGIEYKF
jgi:hypothetical protein